MKREIIFTTSAPSAGFPDSQAVKYGGLVFVSGQIAIDPATGVLITGDMRAQTRQVLDNIQVILQAAGTSLEWSVDSLCFLAKLRDFPEFNEIYCSYFPLNPPPRATVQAGLPMDGLIEIRIIAGMPET
jgi:2-iminobutanoate/2-iminopropanoate deaminase